MDSQQQLEKAIAFIQADNAERGGLLLIDYLRHHPQSEAGWLWMTNVVGDIDLRLDCLEKALKINPRNQHALAMQAKLQQYRLQQSHSTPSQVQHYSSNEIVTYDAAVANVLADSYQAITPSLPLTEPNSKTALSVKTPAETISPAESTFSVEDDSSWSTTQNQSVQNFKLGLLGGLLGMLLGAGIWGGIGLLTGLQLGYIVLIVGLITGIAVRLMGQGQHSRFGLVGASLTMVGCLIGAYVYLIPTSGTLLPAIILPQLGSMFNVSTIILWLVTILLGYWLSFYHHPANRTSFSAFTTNK